MTLRLAAKRTVQGLALVLALPSAVLCGFGRINFVYSTFAHLYALLPGILGNFLRAAFYKCTLQAFSIDTTIGFGTFFVHPDAIVEPHVSIGSYCVIGRAHLGARTQIASHVEVPSGRHQHTRDSSGNLGDALPGQTRIGSDCWIGASAIILAEVGDGATIGAGAVVVHNIPPRVVAVGNPARVIRAASGEAT